MWGNFFVFRIILEVLKFVFVGRLGHSNDEICNKPKSIILPDNCEPLSCFCGSDCSVIITCENKVLVCGGNR